jgi:hypothetical protein
VLDDEFPGKAVYPLPAVFDWVQDFLHASTSAIIPGMVNMQALGSHVLIPRPFGARMPVANAVVFINELLSRLDFPKAKIDEKFIRSRDLDKTWHWTRVMEGVHRAELQHDPTDFDPQYHEYLVSKFLPPADSPDLYQITHQGDPLSNHPKLEYETLGRIAGYFKDGFPQFKNIPVDFCNGDTEQSHPRFDKYESDLKSVMKLINDANPGVFDQEGKVIPEDWTRIVIPEDTTDVFELYTQILLEALGLTVHWVDSWYYHVRIGEIHCGTNVLRSFAGRT